MLPVLKNGGVLVGGSRVFFQKRARRILPPYYIALGFTLLAIATVVGRKTGTAWDTAIPVTFSGLMAHLLLLQDLFISTVDQINGAFWSISVEWRIYFAFPLLVLIWRKLGPLKTTSLTTLIACVLVCLLRYTPLGADSNATVGIMPQYLALFTLGMLGAGIAYSGDAALVRIRQRMPWRPLVYTGLVLVFAACKTKTAPGMHLPIALSDLLVGLWATSVLIYISVREESLLRRFLAWGPLAFVGSYAYSIYLMHLPLLQILWQILWRPLQLAPFTVFLLQSTLGTAIIVAICYGFFLIGERPFLRLTKRL